MRILKSLLIITTIFTVSAFTTPIKKNIDITESQIIWKGKKILGSQTGTINLKEGYLEMEDDLLTGGKFVVDMTSITVTDLEGEYKGKLERHLKSDDFFGIENHPTATLIINKATKKGNTYDLSGDITIKGITQAINFELEMGVTAATANLKIDRTKFGIRYGSGSFSDDLGDKAISDKFTLDVNLKFE
jgi:polyisoprenoid-binding protein YceI